MTSPWIEAWKAWLVRVAESFAGRSGPQPPSATRASHRPKATPPEQPPPAKKASPHRSGQRHG